MDSLPFFNVDNSDMTDTGSSKNKAVLSGLRIPGSYGKRVPVANAVPFGHVSDQVCEEVFRSVLPAYGLSGSTEEQRYEFIWALAEVFVYGTSQEINWADVKFYFGGSEYSMAGIASICAGRISYVNPVRVWVRNFRKGEFVMRMYEYLSDPMHMEVRQWMAYNYGTTIDNAHYCFDTSSALLYSGMALSFSDRQLIDKLSTFTISRAQSNGQSVGEVDAPSNHAGVVGGTKVADNQASSTSTARAQFKTMRPM